MKKITSYQRLQYKLALEKAKLIHCRIYNDSLEGLNLKEVCHALISKGYKILPKEIKTGLKYFKIK